MNTQDIIFLILTTILIIGMTVSYFQIRGLMLATLIGWVGSWIYYSITHKNLKSISTSKKEV